MPVPRVSVGDESGGGIIRKCSELFLELVESKTELAEVVDRFGLV